MPTYLTDGSGAWFTLGIANNDDLQTTVTTAPVPVPNPPLLTDGDGNWFTLGTNADGSDLILTPVPPPSNPGLASNIILTNLAGQSYVLGVIVAPDGTYLDTTQIPAQPAIGAGFLLVNDILTDVAFSLIQPSVNTQAPVGGIAKGLTTVNVFDPSMYVGAQMLVGTVQVDLEVVTITAVVPGVSFTAKFSLPHGVGAPIIGATFPVRQTTDPLYTQPEMLAYISSALSDFLTEVPLVYQIINNSGVSYTQQNAGLPLTCMYPVRVAAFKYPLRETSIPNLESYDYRWALQSADTPRAYFRNDSPMQTVGVWPRSNNITPLEIIFAARGPQLLGLGDGLPIPDPFCVAIKARVLSYAYSKDGECRSPGLAKFWASRYAFSVKVAKMVLGIIESNEEVSQ